MRRDVQGLRAIAVWVVIAFHAGLPIPGGFVGVDMFFVISGFVITLTLLRNNNRHGRIQLGEFYVRRFNRLFPALAVVVVFTLVAGAYILFPIGPLENAALTGLAALLSVGNIAIALTTGDYFDDSAELNPLLNTWSLGVEEQFYLVFPVLLLMSLWFGRAYLNRLKISFRIAALITATSFALSVVGPLFSTYLDQSILFGFYSPLARAWEFGFGVLIALWAKQGQSNVAPKTSLFLTIVGFSLILASLVLIRDGETFPNLLTVLPVAGTTALILAGSGSQYRGNKILESRFMQWSGDRSYSLYLWHWPLIVLGKIAFGDSPAVMVIAVVFSVFLSALSFKFVEQPNRNRQWRGRKDFAISATKWAAAPFTLSLVLWFSPSQLWGKELVQAMERPIGYSECHATPLAGDQPEWCEFLRSDPSGPPVYLVGDSNAAQYSAGLLAATDQSNRDFLFSTASGCPLIEGVSPVESETDGSLGCSEWQQRLLSELKNRQAGTVILAWSEEPFLSESNWVRYSEGNYTSSPREKIQALNSALVSTVLGLQQVGHEVILVQPTPNWVDPYAWELAGCSLTDLVTGCQQEMPVDYVLQKSQALRETIGQVGSITDSVVIDFLNAICSSEQCQTWNGKYWVYRDSSHLSIRFSEQLAPQWIETLVQFK